MEGRDRCAILLSIASVVEGMLGSNLAYPKLAGLLAVRHGGDLRGIPSREMSGNSLSA